MEANNPAVVDFFTRKRASKKKRYALQIAGPGESSAAAVAATGATVESHAEADEPAPLPRTEQPTAWRDLDDDTPAAPVINTGGRRVADLRGSWRDGDEGEEEKREAEDVRRTHDWHATSTPAKAQSAASATSEALFPTLDQAKTMKAGETHERFLPGGYTRVGSGQSTGRPRLKLDPRTKPLPQLATTNQYGALSEK